MKKFLTFLSLAAFTRANIIPKRDCAADNCLRAIRNADRPGTADCSSYLRATYTPPTVTYYVTQTASVTATETDAQIETDTIHVTATNTIETTEIVTVTATDTITTELPLVNKRQVTVIPLNIPAYATPCAGAVRYSSACSCIGVLPTTLTVVAPSTTITISTTISGTVTISPVVATVSVTVTDTTVDSYATVATSTQTDTTTQTIAAQCLSTNIALSPVSYQSAGVLNIAGVGGSQAVSAASAEECCSSCFQDGYCFGFSWGNYDPTWYNPSDLDQLPPVTPGVDTCYHFVFVNTWLGCDYNGVSFGPYDGGVPAGGSAMFGYGDCRVSAW
ncbi:hypothetical protein TWF694_005806 [Orbilia ellipsospora]|uniref:Apple domain-containing protein n=1 Tax=Orbilia ellipsospora TaxID=2528407 RepID=A0AAV9WTL5_9PEZI